MPAGDKEKGCVMCGMVGKEALKACQGYKDTNSDKERKKSGAETHLFPSYARLWEGGAAVAGWVRL